MLLIFCLIFCQIQPGVAYKSVAYKKACISTCHDDVTNRIVKDIGIGGEGREEESREEKLHEIESSQKND